MQNKTVFAITALSSAAMVYALVMKVIPLVRSGNAFEVLELLVCVGVFLVIIGFVGYSDSDKQEIMDKRIHDDRVEKARYILEQAQERKNLSKSVEKNVTK